MKQFKVNDLITHVRYGKGIVIDIVIKDMYPIKVQFKDSLESFTKEGRYTIDEFAGGLIHGHHDEVKVVPVKPKSIKVKDVTKL